VPRKYRSINLEKRAALYFRMGGKCEARIQCRLHLRERMEGKRWRSAWSSQRNSGRSVGPVFFTLNAD